LIVRSERSYATISSAGCAPHALHTRSVRLWWGGPSKDCWGKTQLARRKQTEKRLNLVLIEPEISYSTNAKLFLLHCCSQITFGT